jgi:predicted O-methyltransferase YrrM
MKNKLSLCVIVGNVENYITRFLDHFEKIADEIIVVQACGNREPDSTMDIAVARGCIIGEYYNVHDWPHVDDFGAARNAALDLATGDWVMWADTDDVITPEDCSTIRKMLPQLGDDIHGVLLPYAIPDDGITLHRERIWRRGAARWINPIHESLKFAPDVPMARFDKVQILHLPHGRRSASSDERNLRILRSIPEDELTSSQLFYMMQSERALGQIEEATATAARLCMAPDAGQPERYEAFLIMGQMSPDAATRSQLYLQAIAVDPARREAYAELAMEALKANQFPLALGWSEVMINLPQPSSWWWNSRKKFYAWQGIQVRGMCLRANDRHEEANAIEANHFILHGAKISLLHATRGRPAMAYKARATWLDRAADPDAIEHIFALDEDDETIGPFVTCRHVINYLRGPVAAWNEAAWFSKGEILIQLSDDWEPPMHWDKLIIDAIGDTSNPAVLAVSDGHRTDNLLCMAILTRARYLQQGYLFHPEFFSVFSDNHFTDRAYADDVVIDAKHIVIEHLHPAFGKAEMDETYARSNSTQNYDRGSKTFERIKAGVKVPADIGGWCDYSEFYRTIAQAIPDGETFVEIGSWMGQSISVFCQALQDAEKTATVYCIDTFKGEQNQPAHTATVEQHGGSIREVFERNTTDARVRQMIEVIEGDSAESADLFEDGTIDVIYIDAAHDYDSVVKDLAAWFPKIKPNGIFSGHDYPWHEVKRAVDEHAAANGYEIAQIGRVWMRKV